MTQATELRELASLIHVDGSNARVGIGSTAFTPSYPLHISGSGSQRLRIQKTDSGGDADLQLYSPSDSTQWILFGDSTSGNNSGVIKYVHSTNKMHFRTNDVNDRLVIADDGNVGIGTDSPDAGLHINGTSPHMDVGPHGGNRAKFGYHNLDVIIGSTSSTGEIIFKNNIGSTDSPQTGGNDKVTIHDVGMTIHSDTYNILDVQTDSNNDQTSTDGIIKITNYNGTSHLTKAEFRWDESEDLVHVSYGDHGRHISINSSGNVGIGTHSVSPAHTLDVDGAIATREVRHSILPSLTLDFANSKQLDSRITFYRDSVGSYIDSTGVLRYASPNEPRFDHDISTKRSKGLLIEEQRENLLSYSASVADFDFSGGWVNAGSNPIRQNAYADIAPDGTATATLISNLNNTNTDPDLYIYQPHNLNGGELITYSIWVKAYTSANVGKHVEIRGKRIGGTSASFGKVATLTSEWQRVVVSCQYNADNNNIARLYVGARSNYGNFTDDDGSTVAFDPASEALFWGAQAEEGPFATSYIPTRLTDSTRSSTATYQDKDGVLRYAGPNEPRYGYKWDGQKYAPVGLLVEPNVQQIAPQTETIGSAWYTTSYTKENVRITLPNGTVGSAVKVIMNSGQSANSPTALGFYIGAFTRQTGIVYNTSFFAKTNDENGLRIRDGLRTGAFLDINLNNGEIVANNSSVFYDVMVEKYAHGWWRISYNYDSTSSGTGGWHAIRSYNNGNGSKGFLFWGAQLTTASYTQYNGLSSYIPNPGGGWGVVTRTADVPNGAPTTRYKDVAQINDMQYADWNREEEGTFYVEHETPYDIEDISVNYRILERHNEVTGDSISILHNSSTDQLNAGSIVGAGWQALMGVSSPYGEVNKNTVWKTALGFKEDDFGVSVQGSPAATDSSGLVPRGNYVLSLGDNWNGDNTLNGHLKLVRFYPERLSNAELVALTENS